MARNRIFRPRGSSAARSLVAGLVLLTSIMGCAHFGKSPPSASTTGSTSRPPETADATKGSAAREDAAASPSAHQALRTRQTMGRQKPARRRRRARNTINLRLRVHHRRTRPTTRRSPRREVAAEAPPRARRPPRRRKAAQHLTRSSPGLRPTGRPRWGSPRSSNAFEIPTPSASSPSSHSRIRSMTSSVSCAHII